jgi:N utilization substance protein B
MTDADTHKVAAEFQDSGALAKADQEFFDELLRGVLLRCAELDELLIPNLDRKLSELDKVELAVLRLGTFELKNRTDVPYRVVIDEYIELAKLFGAEDGHKYVNGVLNKLAHSLRSVEVAAHERI